MYVLASRDETLDCTGTNPDFRFTNKYCDLFGGLQVLKYYIKLGHLGYHVSS